MVLTAYFVGNRFSKMVYEVLIDTNGTPYMQEIPKALYNVPVAKVMLPINASHVSPRRFPVSTSVASYPIHNVCFW